MPKKTDMPRGPSGLSRREVLAGVAIVALTARVSAIHPPAKKKQSRTPRSTGTSVRRYMAASAVLPDGRILVTGGYDRPKVGESNPQALNSAVIFDPRDNMWSTAAPMRVQRARHAAVALQDGRIAVLGGMAMNPTASVEIYDPRTNSWEAGAPLAQPRYDHSAASDGGNVYVLGGSSNTMLSSVEVLQL